MKKNVIYTSIASSVILAFNTAYAEIKHSQQIEQLEQINVTAGSMYRMGEVPFYQAKSAVSLSREDLDRQGVRKADEIGRYQAGFTNQIFGNDTNTNWFRIRGTEVSQAVDGLPTFSYGFFTPYVETFGLEAIEITKGADAMTFGAAQAGGLINYVSKRPHKEQIGKGEFSVNMGNKSQYGVAADYTGSMNRDDSLRYRVVTTYNRKDGDWDKTHNKTFYIAPSLSWDISDHTQLTLLASYQRDHGIPSSNFLPQKGTLTSLPSGSYINRSTNFGDPANDREKNRQHSLGYEFRHDFANGLTFNSSYRYTRVENYHRGAYVYPFPNGYDLYRGVVFNDGISKNHTLNNYLIWHYQKDWLKNTLVFGTDYRDQAVDTRYTLFGKTSTTNILDANIGYNQPQDLSPAENRFIKYRQLGIYLQNQSHFADKIILGLGLRHDKAKIEENNLAEQAKYNQTTYSASLMYESKFGLNPYFSYSESFQMPIGISGVNELYDPQMTRQYELGIKYIPTWVDGTISFAGFQAKVEGALISQNRGATVSSEVPIKRKGIELQADINLIQNWNIVLAYTYLKAYKDTASENIPLPLLPKHSVAGRTTYYFDSGILEGLTLGAGIRYNGKTVTDRGSLNPNKKVPSNTVVDLMAYYQITPNWSTQINVDNVSNRRYISGCDYYCYYGAERNINASLNYKF
ncbi:TonB-dependent siderophore receptor [Rodentibacter caecimuris]|uniref:CirA protein n=1 Tax=Rodentibacter caecimuris TaxID=1796644 RepID=A0ABX3KWI7_9PAST|nr:CirA protein [Rodentibacter heylii]